MGDLKQGEPAFQRITLALFAGALATYASLYTTQSLRDPGLLSLYAVGFLINGQLRHVVGLIAGLLVLGLGAAMLLIHLAPAAAPIEP